jgi:hypothetical protein
LDAPRLHPEVEARAIRIAHRDDAFAVSLPTKQRPLPGGNGRCVAQEMASKSGGYAAIS